MLLGFITSLFDVALFLDAVATNFVATFKITLLFLIKFF